MYFLKKIFDDIIKYSKYEINSKLIEKQDYLRIT